MKDEKKFDLLTTEREAFESLDKEKNPPDHLEEQTVRMLKKRGLIFPRNTFSLFHPRAMAVTLPVTMAISLVVLFAAGF